MKKLFIILLVLISINSYAVTSLGNFSTNNTRRIVSNSVTIVRWTFTTIADLFTIYNKTECAVKTEQLESHDIIPIIIGISGASNLVPYVPESRMIISIIPNTFIYNVNKIQNSKRESDDGDVSMRFYGDEVKEMLER